MTYAPLTEQDKLRYSTISQENIDFLMNRNNRINRWVIADMIRRTRYHYPDKTALIFDDISLTYSQLEDQCNQTANALAGLGVKKYDRVAILAHNTHHHVLTWLGCAKIGAIYLAVNYLLRDDDIAYCINHSESTVFIVEDSLYDNVKGVLDKMPQVRHLIWSDQGAGQPAPDGFTDFNAWYGQAPATEPDVILRIEDPVQMTYTSGTESQPKGVIISNQALIAEYMGCIIDGRYEPGDININALPIYHCAQRDVFMNPVFWVGGTNILMSPDIGKILAAIETYKATMFFAPPTVWIGMLRHPDFGKLRSVQPGEMLLRRLDHADGDPQGNPGEIPQGRGLQLLRPDRAGAVSLHPQGRGRPGEDRFRRHGRAAYGIPHRRRRRQRDHRRQCARRDLRPRPPCHDHVLQGTGQDRGGDEGRLVPFRGLWASSTRTAISPWSTGKRT